MPLSPSGMRRFSLREWLIIALRVTAMAVLLMCCLPFYYLWRLLGLANPWPRWFLGGIAALANIRIVPDGIKPQGPTFLIANHISWMDIPAIAKLTGSAFVGHDGLASHPLLKWLCSMNDTVFIARHDRASVADQIDQVRSALADTSALTIFPEGTTSDGNTLLPFKSALLSAFEPLPEAIAVQPVLIDYGADAAGIAWIGDEHGLDNFLRILIRKHPVKVVVKFLPLLGGDALANRKTIAAAARNAILTAMGQNEAGF